MMDNLPVHAPALQGTAWFNTERPVTLADLRGKLVLLDFWTYCCINCLHVLEDLNYLEERYRDRPFVVIGVHSPKFEHEDDPESVRQAIVRYGITHPVVLDSGRRTWDAYAGTTEASAVNGQRTAATFQEPSGISFAGGHLYIADTNNHAIRVIDMGTDTVTTLTLHGLCAPGFCLPG